MQRPAARGTQGELKEPERSAEVEVQVQSDCGIRQVFSRGEAAPRKPERTGPWLVRLAVAAVAASCCRSPEYCAFPRPSLHTW